MKYVKTFFILLAFVGLSYLIGAYFALEMNILKWDDGGRYFHALMCIVGFIVIIGIRHSEDILNQ